MKIYLDIAHPAYFHALRNTIRTMSENGHEFLVSAKDKECARDLLDHYKISYYNRGKAANSVLGKAVNILANDFRLYGRVRKFSPDLIISFGSPVAAHVAFLLKKPCIAIEDTECAGAVQKSYKPFVEVILTPSCFTRNLGKKQVRFNSYKELGYLHPNHFTPDPGIKSMLGLGDSDKYIIVRFVSHNALHDFGAHGICKEDMVRIVESLSQKIKVFISSEVKLPAELEKYRLSTPAWKLHDIIASSTLLIGESATMAAEAAVLGVHAIFMDNQGRGYTDELEKRYGLVYNFKSDKVGVDLALAKAMELITNNDTRDKTAESRKRMLEEKIDLTEYLVRFINGYIRHLV